MKPPVERTRAVLPVQSAPQTEAEIAFEASSRPEVTIGYTISLIRRHLKLIVGCVVLAALLAALYTSLARPMYQATSLLSFETEQVNLPQLVQLLASENRIGTEIGVLQARSAAQAVVDSLGLRAQLTAPRRARRSALFTVLRVELNADTVSLVVTVAADSTMAVWRADSTAQRRLARVGDTVHFRGVTFALAPAALKVPQLQLSVISTNAAVDQLQGQLKVSRPSKDADLIAVQVSGGDPVMAASAANLLAQQLISGRRDLQLGRSETNIRFLRHQLDTLGAQLRVAEDTLRAYRESEGVVDAAEAARTQVGRLAKMEADRGALEAERQALAKMLDQARADSAASPGHVALSRSLMSFPTLFRNPAASELFGALATVENERAALLVRRKPADPDVQVLTKRIADLDAQLKTIAETYLQGLTNQVEALNDVAKGFGTALDSLPRKEVQAARRERDVSVQQDLYTLIQTRLKEAQITQAMEDPTVRIVDPAVVPARPVRPRPIINLALALMLGSVIGLTASLARDLTDRSIRSRADALLGSGLPVLGAIPRVEGPRSRLIGRRKRAPTPGLALGAPRKSDGNVDSGSGRAAAKIRSLLITRVDSSAAYAESLNQLYANMMLSYREQPLKIIAVSSPLPGEGKTLTSINLALTLAERQVRVLLVDGDLRRGLVNAVFGCSRKPGFAELLMETARPEQCLRQIAIGDSAHLTILSSGTLLHTPGPLLKIERVRRLLDSLSPQFDLVIIDTPPVNLLADAALLGSASDAVILVVRAGHTQMDTLHFAMDQLTAARAPVIGTVLNDIDLRRHSGDDGSYRYLADVERYYSVREDPARG